MSSTTVVLTAASPRQRPHPDCNIRLWDHQAALVQKCVEMESKRVRHVALVDRPGAGKTNVILSLILETLRSDVRVISSVFGFKSAVKSTTLIVVPHNILTQWVDSLSRFSSSIRVGIVGDYAAVCRLRESSGGRESSGLAGLEYDVLLTTTLFLPSLSMLTFGRVVYDEVDSITEILMRSVASTKTTYYVSATADAFVSKVSGGNYDSRSDMSKDIAAGVVNVSCDAAFLDSSIRLPEPIARTIRVTNHLVDNVLSGIVTEHDIGALNALAYSKLSFDSTLTLDGSSAASVSNVVTTLLRDSATTADRASATLADLEAAVKKVVAEADARIGLLRFQKASEAAIRLVVLDSDATLEALNGDIRKNSELKARHEATSAAVRERLVASSCCLVCYEEIQLAKVVTKCCKHAFCEPCMIAWQRRSTSCPMCQEQLVGFVLVNLAVSSVKDDSSVKAGSSVKDDSAVKDDDSRPRDDGEPDFETQRDKLVVIRELLTWRLRQEGDRFRAIIFSSYDDTFKSVVRELREIGMEHVEFDGGNVAALDAAQREFVSGRKKVLLVNAAFYCAGMNLQAASDVVLMHRMEPATEKQVIGRAQRPGREGTLRVWSVRHQNEMGALPP